MTNGESHDQSHAAGERSVVGFASERLLCELPVLLLERLSRQQSPPYLSVGSRDCPKPPASKAIWRPV